jgi:hypothetical protein
MRKPAAYCSAVLVAACDFEQVLELKADGSLGEKALLIPEMFDALCVWGRELRTGEVGRESFADAVPSEGSFSWGDLRLRRGDVGEPQQTKQPLRRREREKRCELSREGVWKSRLQ